MKRAVALTREIPKTSRGAARAVAALRRLLGIVLLPVLLCGTGVGVGALVRCEMTRGVHAHRCCGEARRAEPTLSKTRCCFELSVEAGQPASCPATDASNTPAVALSVHEIAPGFGARQVRTAPLPAVQPVDRLPVRVRDGPSLVVVHRRFLI